MALNAVLDRNGDLRDAAGNEHGTAYVATKKKLHRYTTTGTGAISMQTDTRSRFQGRAWRLIQVSASWNTAPTTAENFTITQNPGWKGADRPSTVHFSTDPSSPSRTTFLYIWEPPGVEMEGGDEATVAYTNTDARTVKLELVIEVL